MRMGRLKRISSLLVLLMLATMLGGCGESNQEALDERMNTGNIALASEFAPYHEFPVNENPQVSPYKVATDLGNVENSERFKFSAEIQERIVKNAFAVVPQQNSEFFMLYEMNRYDAVPNLVTTDSLLHNYHLFFDYLLKSVEENQLSGELKKLNLGMMQSAGQQYQALQGSAWENAARRNLAFFAVGNRLLDPKAEIPKEVKQEVNAELQHIKEHKETTVSPIMSLGSEPDALESLKEDYTQYIPRGHYTRSDALKSYFQTMMWYGRMSFRLKNEDETRSALLITLALQQGENRQIWEDIYNTTAFFVGQSDDLGGKQYSALIKQVYGQETSLSELTSNESKWKVFLKEASKLQGPSINSIPIFDPSIQPDRDREIKGFRFMGQRYTVDADIFQRLVYREVGDNNQGEQRLLPKSLDIPAAMGSVEAVSILKEMGDYRYQNYPENMSRLQKHISGLEPAKWHQNLYWGWMNTLKPLTKEVPAGYPSFMRNQSWARKDINTFLGSWTELKHDTILYAKQVYAEAGGGGEEEIDDRGYVEPNPHLYARLASLSAMTREGLQSRKLLSERDAESLKRLEKLALDFKVISEKELQNQSLSSEEYELIRSYGAQLEHFWLETLRDQEQRRSELLTNNPAMLVTDVATAPPYAVLQEATGYVHSLYAVVPVEGKLRIVKGGVYSTYEFTGAASHRLTDEAWREMLYNNQVPEAPAWTQSFMVKGEARSVMPWENEQ